MIQTARVQGAEASGNVEAKPLYLCLAEMPVAPPAWPVAPAAGTVAPAAGTVAPAAGTVAPVKLAAVQAARPVRRTMRLR